MRSSPLFRIVFPLLLLGAGCGRGASAPEPATAPQLDSAPAPAAEAASDGPADLDTLERDLFASEQRLNRYLASRTEGSSIALREEKARVESKKADKPKSPAATGGADFAEPPPPAAAPRPGRKRAEERPADAAPAEPEPEAPASVAEAQAESSEGSVCELACRAFGSMQRSAERICAIAGEDDDRCRRARSRVADASARISGARCSCQSDE